MMGFSSISDIQRILEHPALKAPPPRVVLGLYRCYIGIVENKTETIMIVYSGILGNILGKPYYLLYIPIMVA